MLFGARLEIFEKQLNFYWATAREMKIGLWAAKQPVSPWIFRNKLTPKS